MKSRKLMLIFCVVMNFCAVMTASQCPSEKLDIRGGSFSLSKGFSDGSVLRYSCGPDFYPTVNIRRCANGRWQPVLRKRPTCRKITCPDPRGFNNGEVIPYQAQYYVNSTTSYSCYSDHIFSGSNERVCQPNGKWSGATPICGKNSDHCPDPGTPPGARRSGNKFFFSDKVTYECDRGLTLIGSKVRVCQDDGQWSGSEPECYADFTYDTPVEAAEVFSSSLKATLQLSHDSETTDQYGKKISLDKDGKLDIYIGLDVSDSIEEEDFKKAKHVISTLIEKISDYEVSPNYEISMFATDVYKIISMRDFKISQQKNLDDVLKRLNGFTYDRKGQRSGTDIAKVYKSILESMQIEKINNNTNFLQTKQVIIVFTDGQYNMGGNPKIKVDTIKMFVTRNEPSREDKLEMYVFGMGVNVHAEDINDLKTDRNNEKFFFKLRNLNALQKTFDRMLDEGSRVSLCGLYRDDTPQLHYPWLAQITVDHKQGSSNCLGSLVTSSFILTAAHCFTSDDTPENVNVMMGSQRKVKQFILHPRFNLKAKQNMGIKEYYEFDVALIQLEEPVNMSTALRPICIPCTKETSGALKLTDSEGTCRKHQEVLMSTVDAAFLSKVDGQIEQRAIKIKQGKWRDVCVEDAKKAEGINATNAKDVVSDNFLCSGGTEPEQDSVSCKGDSGGATFVVPGQRMIQVGVVSWGVKNLCKKKVNPLSDKESRDYHSNLFSEDIRSFLKLYLGNGMMGAPLHFF